MCRVPPCKCLAPVQPPQAASPSQAQAGPEEDFPVLGHPFNGLQDWDPSHETSLELESLWQIPPGALFSVAYPTLLMAVLLFVLCQCELECLGTLLWGLMGPGTLTFGMLLLSSDW